MTVKTGALPYILSGISGLVSVLPFFVADAYLVEWFALVPLFYCLQKYRENTKLVAAFTLIRSFIFYVCLYYWFYALCPLDFAGIGDSASVILMTLAILLISLLHTFEITLFMYVAHKIPIKHAKYVYPFFIAVFFTLSEYFQSLGTFGFTWGHLYLTQYKCLPAIQSVSVLGPYFLTFLLVLVNACIASAVIRKGKMRIVFATVFVLAFSANYVFGIFCIEQKKTLGKDVTAAVIQGNISYDDKWSGSTEKVLQKHIELTDKALAQAKRDGKSLDLFVFSESAIPVFLEADGKTNDTFVSESFKDLHKRSGAVIFAGGFYENGGNEYNAMYMLPHGEDVTPYMKRHLVPFGEFLPYRTFFEKVMPFLSDINALSDDLSSGSNPAVFSTSFGKVGALVCYDSIFSPLARESAKSGAELIVIGTNDSWYKDSMAVYQHAAQSVLRAVETGRYILRSANTGISLVVTNYGKVTDSLPVLQDGYIVANAKMCTEKTLYTYVGNIFLALAFLVAVFFIDVKKLIYRAVNRKNSKKEKTKKSNKAE